MGDKTCNRCGKKKLGWDYKFYKQTKKWKLENHKRDDMKWCNKPPERLTQRTKYDMVLCKLCDGSSFGLCTKNGLEKHIKLMHPDGRSLSDLDIMMGSSPEMAPFILQYWRGDKNYHRYKHLDKYSNNE